METEDYDWKKAKVTNPEERSASCFVSPEGDWYNVNFGDHWQFTKSVLKEMYGRTYGTPYEETRKLIREGQGEWEKELYDLGWVWIHDDIWSGTIVRGKMNAKQHKVLKESFGNQRLFRGWTIDQMYHGQDRG